MAAAVEALADFDLDSSKRHLFQPGIKHPVTQIFLHRLQSGDSFFQFRMARLGTADCDSAGLYNSPAFRDENCRGVHTFRALAKHSPPPELSNM